MIVPRKVARRLLDEFLDGVRKTGVVEADTGDVDYEALEAIRDDVLEESDLVLRGVENAEQKARRYLTEGRLTVERVDAESGLVVASCAGAEGVYKLGRDPANGQWRCTCPAPRKCSHLIALRLVVRL